MASLQWQELARTRPFLVELDGLTAGLVVQALALLDSDIGKKIRAHDDNPERGSLHLKGILRADALLVVKLAADIERAHRAAIVADEETDARFEVVKASERRSA